MLSASTSLEVPSHRLYHLCLPKNTPSTYSEGVILTATLTEQGKSKQIQFDEETGDNTLNLSACLGVENDTLKLGLSGFHHKARKVEIVQRNAGERSLVMELQDSFGDFRPAEINLDQHFDFIEYVHPTRNETYYRLGRKDSARPAARLRSLVLSFDGTSNHFSNQNTNVVKLMELLKKNDPDRQLVYYQTGVGTYGPPGLVTSAGLELAKTVDKGFASFLYQHVIDGYKFLMETYRDGDRISIFGFSRGAFTARALAGMLHCVGLLPKHNPEHVPFAYEVYKNAEEGKARPRERVSRQPTPSRSSSLVSHSSEPVGALLRYHDCTTAKDIRPEDFKRTFCNSVKIDFVGVWDTVASVGSLWPTTLPWTNYNPSIRHFRQALALDERRANFIPSVWDHSRTDPTYQTALEVWFKGGHTDVGGGAVPKRDCTNGGDKAPQSMLSNISLRWMIRQCFDLDTGIIFDHRALKRYRDERVLEPRPPRQRDESVAEYNHRLLQRSAELDKADIIYAPYDAMCEQPIWNMLEFLPSAKPTQTEAGLSMTRRPNRYKPRLVWPHQPTDRVCIHASVVDHLASSSGQYRPRALWKGYDSEHYPHIIDGIEEIAGWTPQAKDAMNMHWKTAGHKKCRKPPILRWGRGSEESKLIKLAEQYP